ncbi:cytochrome-c peroxidase [Thaumasiovibrio subtropicus]|uniref:cytochrome-c peroxidase n=1 Tax=Thaumasiovibrio subtropicus TaxID=1891207 RepID=UPI0039C9084F
MKKAAIVLGIAASGYLLTVYAVDRFDNKMSVLRKENIDLTQHQAITASAFDIIADKGCQYCHSQDSDMPFYAKMPVASQLMDADIRQGLRHFDIVPLLENMATGNKISEVDLAKIDGVLNDGSMPPTRYLAMHWRSSLSTQDKKTLQDWIAHERSRHHDQTTLADVHINSPVQPITTISDVDIAKVSLGDKLYHDVRLSGDDTISCASCHSLDTGGVDRLDSSVGVGGAVGPINAPTVFNSVFNTHQFWDGRAADLQAQAGGPPLNPIEMASESWEQITGKLNLDTALVEEFAAIYPEGITEHSITDAIAEFEKTLITPNSRFDQFLQGNQDALSAKEQQGYALFNQYKCSTCHVGEAMGGQSFEIMGLKNDYFAARGNVTDVDFGRFNVTGREEDKYRFKTPTLRNVALTAPYFHDAYAQTLEEAVDMMAFYQVGVQLSRDEVEKITAYLHTLTGEYKGQQLQ